MAAFTAPAPAPAPEPAAAATPHFGHHHGHHNHGRFEFEITLEGGDDGEDDGYGRRHHGRQREIIIDVELD